MILIVGLGNPGKKYQKSRHNLGFQVVDELAANFQFPVFNSQSIFKAKISKQTIADQEIILVKPQTFMNNSGLSIKSLIKNLKLKIKNLIIIHDDIDLPLGRFKIVKNRGSAGHKGVESVIKELGTKNFIRFRIGICPKRGKPKNIEKFVLEKFNREEEKIIREIIKKVIGAIEFGLKYSTKKAMGKYN